MQLSEIRTRARIYLDDRGTSTRYSDSEINGLINAAQEEIQKIIDDSDEYYFSAVQTYNVVTCTTTLEFSLPADFKRVILAERIMTDGSDPQPAVWAAFPRRHLAHTQNCSLSPTCSLRGTKLQVIEPEESYTLRMWYTKKLPDLSADSDVSEIPLEYHNLLALYTARVAIASEQRQFNPTLEQEFQEQMGRLIRHIEHRDAQGPHFVIDREYDQWLS